MATDKGNLEEDFLEAKEYWDLEKLYVDLALAKGKALTPVEKKFLRGLLCGFSPAEIASEVYQSRNSSTVRVYLSNGLYKYLEEMLSLQSGNTIKVKSWSRVTHLLEKAGYKKGSLQLEFVNNHREADFLENNIDTIKPIINQDWGEAIDVSSFYGREAELEKSIQWIEQDNCRLVVILGQAGIGKTAFSVKLAESLQSEFDFVIWRSLRLTPTIDVLLNQLIEFFVDNQKIQDSEPPETETGHGSQTRHVTSVQDNRISQLIDCLRASRCLVVLDSVDSIFEGSNNKGLQVDILPQMRYRPGYEAYGELIRRLGESQHTSCVVLTSREKLQEVALLEGENLPVRSLKISSLNYTESLEILKAKGFTQASEESLRLLINWYAGNPLFLKLVATTIHDLFDDDIYEFIEQGTVVFGDIRAIIDEQFNRLSTIEKQIMYWLTLNQNAVSLRKLQKDIVPKVSQRVILEALEMLQRRSLIERQGTNFSLVPVFAEYMAERIIEQNFKLNEKQTDSLFMSNTIFEAQLKNYIREKRLNAEL